MNPILDFSKFQFTEEQIRNVRDLVWDEIIKAPAISRLFTIYPNVVTGKQVGFIGEGGLVIRADEGCGSRPNEWNIGTRTITWNPEPWEAYIQECYSELENTAAVYALKRNIDRADLTETDYMQIVVDVLSESIKKSVIALALFGNTASSNDNINLFDGIFTQMVASATQTPSLQVSGAVDANFFAKMILAADPVLRGDETARVYTTQSLYNQYIQSLMAKDNSASFQMFLDGYQPSVLGVRIEVLPILDSIAQLTGNDANFAFYTAPKYLGLGVDHDNFGDVDVYYDRATKVMHLRALGKMDAKLLHPTRFVLGIGGGTTPGGGGEVNAYLVSEYSLFQALNRTDVELYGDAVFGNCLDSGYIGANDNQNNIFKVFVKQGAHLQMKQGQSGTVPANWEEILTEACGIHHELPTGGCGSIDVNL